ncbi:MAG: hypothetical protein HY938_06720 [Nitrosomonadales bacterium]|nr:hypothetical protein [Nitrosomonadales bacterium]
MASKQSQITLACLLVVTILLTGCSQHSLLTRQDYQNSQQDFLRGDAEKALRDFPRKAEADTFITTMEKGYLSLIQGKSEIAGLQKQAEVLEKRVRYHVSREARNFFYALTPEDYYASEHEVIWMHFLLSWGYSLQEKFGDACVEARVASSLLSLPWSPGGHFDDPAMRLFLAGLWTMCGEWREARVDLRAAWYMDNTLVWAKELAERSEPPPHLFIVLGGPGPEPVWNPELTVYPLRSERQLNFRLRGRRSPLAITDQNGFKIAAHLSPDAGNWYERHLARESELHELILDSTYGGKAALSGTVAGSKIAATTGVGLALGIGGTALGAAIIYYGNSAEAIELGLATAWLSINEGMKLAREEYQESTRQFKQELDPSASYRFVRYLPEYLWMGWSDETIDYPVELRTSSARITIKQPGIANQNYVTIVHLPDPGISCGYIPSDGSITYIPLRDGTENCRPDTSSPDRKRDTSRKPGDQTDFSIMLQRLTHPETNPKLTPPIPSYPRMRPF